VWLSELAGRFEVALSPYPAAVFDEVSAVCFGGVAFAEIGERSPLPPPAPRRAAVPAPPARALAEGPGLRLLRYRPLFSGPAVERTSELDFQRPGEEIELAPADAASRGVASGDEVTVSSNGTAVRLRARVVRDLPAGNVRIARSLAPELHDRVEVSA
jgi:anaerobic selenocysteine-containing dehydrogenase